MSICARARPERFAWLLGLVYHRIDAALAAQAEHVSDLLKMDTARRSERVLILPVGPSAV